MRGIEALWYVAAVRPAVSRLVSPVWASSVLGTSTALPKGIHGETPDSKLLLVIRLPSTTKGGSGGADVTSTSVVSTGGALVSVAVEVVGSLVGSGGLELVISVVLVLLLPVSLSPGSLVTEASGSEVTSVVALVRVSTGESIEVVTSVVSSVSSGSSVSSPGGLLPAP